MQIKNVRFIIAAITTLSAYAVYVSRVNLSIAIIAMVDDGHQHAISSVNGSEKLSSPPTPTMPLPLANVSLISNETINELHTRHRMRSVDTPSGAANASSLDSQQTLDAPHRAPMAMPMFPPASKKSMLRAPLISQEKFNWDQTAQGHILGAFFYGYIIFQLPGARMAERVGARWIIIAATAGSALISLIFPLSTQLNSIHLLMVLRFVMGLCQSAFFPAAYVFFCRWLPENERSVLLPIMFIGSNMGSISTYILSSYLISSTYGWPSVFYVSGLICLIVTLSWFTIGSNGPEDNWLITDEERNYILSNINNQRDEFEKANDRQIYQNNSGSSKKPACCIVNNNNSNSLKLSKEIVKLNQLNAKETLNNENNITLIPQQISHIKHLHGKLNKSKSANDLIPAETAARLLEQQQHIIQNTSKAMVAIDINKNNNNCDSGNNMANLEPVRHRQLSWSKMLTSLPIWTLILSMYGNEWSQVVLTYELPTYLNTALKLPIEQNGVINSFFQLSYTLASPIMSSLGAYLLNRHLMNMRKIHVRKLFQSLATFGQMVCFVSVPICGPNEGLIIMFMFSAIVFKSCANAGDIMIPGDLSPEFAGTIFAFANSIGNTAGVLVPLLAGLIVRDPYKRAAWTPFWLTTASIMCFSGLIFLIFGQTNRQNYSLDEAEDDEEEEANEKTRETRSRVLQSKKPLRLSVK